MKRNISISLFLLFSSFPALHAYNPTQVVTDLKERMESTARPELFEELKNISDSSSRKALEFLYAYMPLPDITDYTTDFYNENVSYALLSRKEMPWGSSVPDREWYHFVLPVRVNNENLDHSRKIFYEELKERVKGMSMAEAVLEVNHWCHEKVTYQPSDSRTSSPLASIKSAYGRCGEESTFTVAALRSIGIPARQVYTPRWAHTDDNHAWVEAWVDGQWHFLGACEPEAVLDLGWFNAPASRGMLMNTKAFGRYDGPEQKLSGSNCYTEINVTSNYAPVDSLTVTVTDDKGQPVKGARVDFRLYNYAEFYPIATAVTDSEGKASLVAGLGDLLVWVSHEGGFGFTKATVGKDRHITLSADKDNYNGLSFALDVVPPVQRNTLPLVTEAAAKLNDQRKQREDSIRNAYMATFFTVETAESWAKANGYDDTKVADILVKSRGNHEVITEFLRSVSEPERRKAVALLSVVSDKDLRDVTPEVLADHLATPDNGNSRFEEYILNPRVANEMLTPYKQFFSKEIPQADMKRFASDPQSWVKWCSENIRIDNDWNPQNLRMSPEAVWRHRITDKGSRDIFFVAAARCMGIPARIDPVTEKTQYMSPDGDEWIDADFQTQVVRNSPQGLLKPEQAETGRIEDPVYYTHFTLSKINDGVPRLLNFPEEARLSDIFGSPVNLDEGDYLLVTGQRMASGAVLTQLTFFNISDGKVSSPRLSLRQDSTAISVIGNFNSENIYHDIAEDSDKSLLSTTGRGYYILGLISPNHEPSIHALNDISAYKEDFEKDGRSIVLLFAGQDDAARFDSSRFQSLPNTVTFGTDIDGKIKDEIVSALNLDSADMPVFIIADTFNRVVFATQGYTIGTGEKLTDILKRLQ